MARPMISGIFGTTEFPSAASRSILEGIRILIRVIRRALPTSADFKQKGPPMIRISLDGLGMDEAKAIELVNRMNTEDNRKWVLERNFVGYEQYQDFTFTDAFNHQK